MIAGFAAAIPCRRAARFGCPPERFIKTLAV
jgi:hypothetical protein